MLAFLLGGALAISIYAQIRHAQLAGGFLSQQMVVIFNAMTGGAVLMMAVLVAAGFVIVPGNGRRLKIAITVATLPMILGIIVTMTRSAALGLAAGLSVMLLLAKPRLFGVFLVSLLALAVILALYGEHFLPPQVWSRIDPQYVMTGESTIQRLEMWRGGLEMVKAHPLTGVGDRGLQAIAPDYYTSTDGKYFGHLHSNILHMSAIWGIPGLILGQSFLFAGLWYVVKRWRWLRRRSERMRQAPAAGGWALGAIGVWLGFYVAGLTEWYFGDAESMLIYLAILGCALGPLPDPGDAAAAV
jgi:O-antigen ligase